MKRAALFAGQGAEEPRMGLDLAAHSPRARALLEHAAQITGVDLVRELARGSTQWSRTETLQPALVAVSLGAWEALRERGLDVDFVAGHSLGEVSAWAAAEGITAEEAIGFSVTRARAMALAATAAPGGMIALTRVDASCIEAALDVGRAVGRVALAAYNAPHEWVVSGEVAALDAIARGFETTKIPAAGPWHSPAMAAAREETARGLARIPPRPLARTMISCVTATRIADTSAVSRSVLDGLTQPVRWAETLRALRDSGVDEFVIVGPGRVLRGLVRKNFGATMDVRIVDDMASLDALAGAVGTL